LPAVIVGTENAWPKGESFMRPANITIKILPPITSKDKSNLTEKAYNKELSTQTKKLENMIIKALKEFENK
jgi:1-acyl-sn-glycerol-3-phosphate acyltransferase